MHWHPSQVSSQLSEFQVKSSQNVRFESDSPTDYSVTRVNKSGLSCSIGLQEIRPASFSRNYSKTRRAKKTLTANVIIPAVRTSAWIWRRPWNYACQINIVLSRSRSNFVSYKTLSRFVVFFIIYFSSPHMCIIKCTIVTMTRTDNCYCWTHVATSNYCKVLMSLWHRQCSKVVGLEAMQKKTKKK